MDFDDDGRLDLVLRQGDVARIIINNGDETFSDIMQANGYDFADWNGDARTDLLSWSGRELTIQLQGIDGALEESFRMTLPESYASVERVGDFDLDGDLDFLLRSGTIHVMMNAGDGTFEEREIPISNVDRIEFRDLNDDGWQDVMAWSWSSDVIVSFGDPTNPYSHTVALPSAWSHHFLDEPVDLDHDGYFDSVMAFELEGPTPRVVVMWGGPLDQLRPPTDLVLPGQTVPPYDDSLTIAAQDIDQDGDHDLVLADSRVIYNQIDRFRPWGDVDGSGQIDVGDVDALSLAIREQDPRPPLFDLNRDDRLDGDDLRYLVQELLGTVPGDADLDGKFDSLDMVAVFQVGEYEDSIPGNSTWADGDWNGDGDFNSADMVLAFQTGSYIEAAQAILPETLSAITPDIAQAIQWLSSSENAKRRQPAIR